MTELEKLQRALMYMEKLADGVDPITDTELPSDTALNNVRLARCFFFVAGVLRQVIDGGGAAKPQKRPARPAFSLTEEQRRQFQYTGRPVTITQFVEMLNGVTGDVNMKLLKTTPITAWLVEQGYLRDELDANGKKRRRLTPLGASVGMTEELRSGQFFSYYVVLFGDAAQRFIMDNLDVILGKSG